MSNDKIVGIRGEYAPASQPNPDPDVISLLESALEGAKTGYLREVVICGITEDFSAVIDIAGEPHNDTYMYGNIMEAAARYRELQQEVEWIEEE